LKAVITEMYRSTYPLGTGGVSHFGNHWFKGFRVTAQQFILWQEFTHTHVSPTAQNTVLHQELVQTMKVTEDSVQRDINWFYLQTLM